MWFRLLGISLFLCPILGNAGSNCGGLIPIGADWKFLRASVNSSKPVSEKVIAVDGACRELDAEKGIGQLIKPNPLAIPGHNSIHAALISREVLGNSPLEQEYKSELEKIKLEPKAAARVEATYNLVTRYQGQYDDKRASSTDQTVRSVSQVLATAKSTGKGGVCRDFSNLLYWSLSQVSQSTSTDKNKETFSSTIVDSDSTGPKSWEGHQWIRVTLPARPMEKNSPFDLDTTAFPKAFTPLFPRLTKSAQEVDTMYDSCMKVKNCLFDNMLSSEQSNPKLNGTGSAVFAGH
jgi:hypothetical protein